MTLVVVLLAVCVAVLTLLVAGLLRSHATILRRLHELDPAAPHQGDDHEASRHDAAHTHPGPARTAPPTGRAAHDVTGTSPAGATTALRIVGADHDTVLAFLSSGCATCSAFWSALAAPELPLGCRLVIVTRGPEDELVEEVTRLAPAGVTVVMSSAAWEAYEVPGSPYVVHVDGPAGRVRGEGTGVDWAQVRRLLHLAGADARGAGKASADARREHDIDRTLLAAGIAPGDASLYRHVAPDGPDADGRAALPLVDGGPERPEGP